MTGLDLLKQEMKKAGLNQAQCDSKVAAVVLDILAQSGDTYKDLREAENRINILEKREQIIKANILSAEVELEQVRQRINAARDIEWIDAPEYIQEFYSALEKCETAGGRDALKAAQMFVNTVSPKSAYDNTAFIIGLSAILSNGKIAPIEELKKINKKIPSPVMWRI